MPFAPLIQCNTCQRRRLGSRLFHFLLPVSLSLSPFPTHTHTQRAGNSGKEFGIWKMKSSSNFCVFINIPIALFAIYSGKPLKVFGRGEGTRGRVVAWLTAIARCCWRCCCCSGCCCHIPFMVFIVCGNSCCLNYAKFTPQPNIESRQQRSPLAAQPHSPPTRHHHHHHYDDLHRQQHPGCHHRRGYCSSASYFGYF